MCENQTTHDFAGDGSPEQLIRGCGLWLRSCPAVLNRLEKLRLIDMCLKSLSEDVDILLPPNKVKTLRRTWCREIGVWSK